MEGREENGLAMSREKGPIRNSKSNVGARSRCRLGWDLDCAVRILTLGNGTPMSFFTFGLVNGKRVLLNLDLWTVSGWLCGFNAGKSVFIWGRQLLLEAVHILLAD